MDVATVMSAFGFRLYFKASLECCHWSDKLSTNAGKLSYPSKKLNAMQKHISAN